MDIEASKKEDCDDLQFFKSLIPFIKQLSPPEKLTARGEIQNVILKYINKTATSSTPTPSQHSWNEDCYEYEYL